MAVVSAAKTQDRTITDSFNRGIKQAYNYRGETFVIIRDFSILSFNFFKKSCVASGR